MILRRMKNKIKRGITKAYLTMCYKRNIQFGKKLTFRKQFLVEIRENGKIIIGDECFFNNYCSINSFGCICIGNNCIFGENVKIYDHNHNFKNKNDLISKSGYSVGFIKIGNNCWIGTNSVILKGANIGEGCVIGAGCIIDCEIPPFSVVTMQRELIVSSRK